MYTYMISQSATQSPPVLAHSRHAAQQLCIAADVLPLPLLLAPLMRQGGRGLP